MAMSDKMQVAGNHQNFSSTASTANPHPSIPVANAKANAAAGGKKKPSRFAEGRLKLSTSCTECHRRKQKVR